MKEVTANQLTIIIPTREQAKAFGEAYARIIHRGMKQQQRPKIAPQEAKPQPPAHLHPLQRMSSQPSAFGQSMWRPWE